MEAKDPKSVIREDFDRSGQYEAGLKSLVKSLQWAFAFLLVVIIAMLLYFFTGGGYFAVEPQRAVIVLKFGQMLPETYTSGGHWFLPYPVHQFIRIQTNQQFMDVNFIAAEMPGEGAQKSLEPGRDSYLLTGDANIIHTSWRISFQVSNPAKYYESLATPTDPMADDVAETDVNGFVYARGPQTMIRNLFRRAVIQVTSTQKAAEILNTSSGQYSEEVRRVFSELVAQADCGVTVDNVTLDRIFPPEKTKAAFDEVAAAGNTRSTLINQAREYEVQTANSALARAAEIRTAAEIYRTTAVSEVQAESRYFEAINKEYVKSPATVLMTLYTSVLSETLSSQDGKYILGSSTGNDHKQVRIKLNPEPKRQTGNGTATAEEK